MHGQDVIAQFARSGSTRALGATEMGLGIKHFGPSRNGKWRGLEIPRDVVVWIAFCGRFVAVGVWKQSRI
jgi:hypothetical protein